MRLKKTRNSSNLSGSEWRYSWNNREQSGRPPDCDIEKRISGVVCACCQTWTRSCSKSKSDRSRPWSSVQHPHQIFEVYDIAVLSSLMSRTYSRINLRASFVNDQKGEVSSNTLTWRNMQWGPPSSKTSSSIHVLRERFFSRCLHVTPPRYHHHGRIWKNHINRIDPLVLEHNGAKAGLYPCTCNYL